MADDSKTEQATPKKRRDERKKGHVLMSKDVVAVASLFAGMAALRVMGGGIVRTIREYFDYCFKLLKEPGSQLYDGLLIDSIFTVVRTVIPLLIVSGLTAIVATMAQTRMLVTFEPLKPSLEKIDPLKGFKKLFSLNSVVDALKGILKICVLMVMIYNALRDMMSIAENYLYADVSNACVHLVDSIFSMLLNVAIAFLVLAALDYLYQWWNFERQMKMSKQEVKEEYKQTEGDPKIKGKIKQLQMQAAQRRMMQQVPQADVVVRNPTHYAVALRYHPHEDDAPIVLAKGQDELAMRIVKTAEEHGVTVLENVPLARALYAQAELNSQIPPELFDMVAEVMVYLYKLGKLKM